MSFLSKRSRSQRSFMRGSDEISVRRREPSDEIVHLRTDTLRSDSSSPVTLNATDFKLNSCVLQKFPKHKSSHLRFLAWVAYTRKFTDEPITEDERRTCPLLWCRTVFEDQETMLQHVWDCEHLSKGLYWCFHCQKPEQVGSFECRRCQGTPSKADRITTVAKRIFSKLGSKRHRTPKAPEPEPDMSIAKYAEESKTLEHHPDFPTMYDAGPAGEFNSQAFSSGGILEWRASQELPDTQICEMIGSECPIETSSGTNQDWNGEGLSNPESTWFSPESLSKTVCPSNKSRRSLVMLPTLNTQLSNLNPERGFDHISSNDTSDEPMSATIIAPGGGDRYASIFQEISPTDTDMTANSFLTDSGYTSGAAYEAWGDVSMSKFELHPGFNEPRGKKRSRDEAATTEALASVGDVLVSRNNSAKSNKSFTNQEQRVVDTVDSSHSPSRCPSTKKPKMQSPHWSSASTLVQSFSEVLDAHIFHTKDILRQLPQTPITTELLAMSRSSMVSIGLEVLAGIIENRNPTAIVQAFAFTHIAYAFTIAIDHDEIKVHTQEWFKDSLSWVDGLGSERERRRYAQIAKAVWQPVESLREEVLPRFFAVDKENRLLIACKRFLDVFESFEPDDSKGQSKPADTAHIAFSKTAQAQVIDELIKARSIEAFIEDVVKVEKRLKRGYIKTVRELELELMCAGKLASQSELAYNRFLAHVTYLCNPLYGSSPSRSRAVFHIQNITLIKNLLPEEMYCGPNGEEDQDFDLELDADLPLDFTLDMLGNIDRRVRDSMDDYVRDADDAFMCGHDLNRSHSTQQPRSSLVISQPRRSKSDQKRPANSVARRSTLSTGFQSSLPSSAHQPPRSAPVPAPSHSLLSPHPKVTEESPSTSPELSTSNAPTPSHTGKIQSYQCDLCNYLPTGDEKWKASNLRRHKRTQHAAADKKGSYICQWRGCTKSFTRSDNLRSHMRDKGHGLGEGFMNGGMDESDAEQSDQSALHSVRGVNGNTQQRDSDERGAKRRKMIG